MTDYDRLSMTKCINCQTSLIDSETINYMLSPLIEGETTNYTFSCTGPYCDECFEKMADDVEQEAKGEP